MILREQIEHIALLIYAKTKVLVRGIYRKLLLDKLFRKPQTKQDFLDYAILLIFIYLFATTLYNITKNTAVSIKTKNETAHLIREKQNYRREILADSLLIEKLKSDQGLEQYAREKFNMKRSKDDIYRIK